MPENQGADPTPVPVTHPLHTVQVAVNTPSHSGVGDLLSYTSPRPLAPGTLVRVPLGQREVLGVVWDATGRRRAAQPATSCAPWPGCWKAWRRWTPPGAAWWRLRRATTSAAWARWPWPPAPAAARPEARAAGTPPAPPAAAGDTFNAIENIALSAEQESARAQIASKKARSCCLAAPAAARPRCTCAACRTCWQAAPPPRRW
jgi:primosomal protein N' (replication factor Y)